MRTLQDDSFAGVLTSKLRKKQEALIKRVIGGQLDHDTYKHTSGQIVALSEAITLVQEIADARYAEEAA